MGSRANSTITSNVDWLKACPVERRQRPRVKSGWPVTIATPGIQIEGEVENISPFGAFVILCQDSLSVEERFRMIIKPPNQRPLKVTGEVVWTQVLTHASGEPCRGMGVRFIHISKVDSQFLHDVVTSAFIL